MIVVDTNLIAHLLLGGPGLEAARATLLRDPDWAAPLLWRSEFRSILTQYVRRRHLSVKDAIAVQKKAEELLSRREHLPASEGVLRLARESDCSTYDCEFVALAQLLGVPLVTSDSEILAAFPRIAVTPSAFSAAS